MNINVHISGQLIGEMDLSPEVITTLAMCDGYVAEAEQAACELELMAARIRAYWAAPWPRGQVL